MSVCTLVALVVLAWSTEGARFLAFLPFHVRSHQRVFQPLLVQLALRGHDVTVLTPFPLEQPPHRYSQIVIQDYSEQVRSKLFKDGSEKSYVDKNGAVMSAAMLVLMREYGLLYTEAVLRDEQVQKLLSSDLEFDGLLLESTFYQEAFVGLQHRFRAVVIELLPSGNSHWAYWNYGNPYDTSYIVEKMLDYPDNMNFLQRLHNTVHSFMARGIWMLYYMPKFETLMNTYLRYEGWEGRPSMMDMVRNVSLVLINTDVSLNYPYPMASNCKEVGGLNLLPPKPLPQDIQDFMDDAKDGVIYFSLGSIIRVSDMLEDAIKDFIKIFAKLKQKVLLKWEITSSDLPENIKVSKWFPQQDILAHKNIKLFITHGGFLSTSEAIVNGVPLIGIPFYGDQHRNIAHMRNYGYGIHLDYFNLSESSISWAINKILINPSYREKAKERSMLYRDKPATALETAVFWVEYVLRHRGATHLRPAVTFLPWYQEVLLDVYGVIALALFLFCYILCKIICILTRIMFGKKKIKNKND